MVIIHDLVDKTLLLYQCSELTKIQIMPGLEPLNVVTIQHSGVTPIPDHLAEQFTGYACGAMLNLYVGYDERPIAESSQDLTTFQTLFN
jgi:hypothetical protein